MVSSLSRALALGLAGAATLALGGCYQDGYGYGGVEVGAGYYDSPYGGYGYGDAYEGGAYYGGGYYGGGYPAYGWFDGFYYPGSGIYIYDRGGHRRQMRDGDWRHWRSGGGEGHAGRGPGDGYGYGGRGPGGGHGDRGGPGGPPPPGAPGPGGYPGQRGLAGQGAMQGQQRPGGNPQGWAAQRSTGNAAPAPGFQNQSRQGFAPRPAPTAPAFAPARGRSHPR